MTMKRLAMILLAAAALCGCSEPKKYIALTFDDGPSITTTMQILDIMEQYDAQGSFFVIGRNINDQSAEVMRRAVALGCQVENHSFTHPHMPQLTLQEQIEQVEQTSAAVVKYLGREPQFFRAPYIDENEQMHQTFKQIFIGGVGNADWDANVKTEQRIQKLMESAEDGVIFLLHDFEGNDQTVQTLEVVIPALQQQGYEFVTVDELFRLKGVTPQKGIRYDRVPQQ